MASPVVQSVSVQRRRGWFAAGLIAALFGLLGGIRLLLWASPERPRSTLADRQPPSLPTSYGPPSPEGVARLRRVVAQLKPHRPPLPPPRAGDWLSEQDELGQLFDDYVGSNPLRPTSERHVIYIQPLGPFNAAERRILEQTAEYIGHYFNLPVQLRAGLPLAVVPAGGFRWREDLHLRQLHTGTVLYQVLRPNLPADAATYIALTTLDLYPEPGWNFVFGQSSAFERVGVWSLARNGDAHLGDGAFHSVLARTLKIATHEIAHMFGLEHCTEHACGLNGVNSLDEADRTPLDLCPECMAKVCWLTGIAPEAWLRRLAASSHKLGLPLEARRFEKTLQLLEPGSN